MGLRLSALQHCTLMIGWVCRLKCHTAVFLESANSPTGIARYFFSCLFSTVSLNLIRSLFESSFIVLLDPHFQAQPLYFRILWAVYWRSIFLLLHANKKIYIYFSNWQLLPCLYPISTVITGNNTDTLQKLETL
jgi:hypothetical protein